MAMKHWLAAAAAACLGACAHVSTLGGDDELAQGIEEEAVAFNEAQTRAASNLILLNVLRARDGWPTNYTTLSGISSQPGQEASSSLGLGPLGLGNPPNPFGESAATLGYSLSSNATYSVNPLASEDIGALYAPLSRDMFQRFARAAWQPETIGAMLVRTANCSRTLADQAALQKRTCAGLLAEYLGQPAEAPTDPNCADVMQISSLTAFLSNSNGFKDTVAALEGIEGGNFRLKALDTGPNGMDGLMLSYCQSDPIAAAGQSAAAAQTEPSTAVAAAAGEMSTGAVLETDLLAILQSPSQRGQSAPVSPAAQTGPRVTFTLRSFDEIIQELGKCIRPTSPQAVRQSEAEAQPENDPSVNACGLFLVEKDTQETDMTHYAASARHRDDRYLAGPADNPADRSGEVLAVLTQLLVAGQSPEFLKAPQTTTLILQ